MDLPATLLDLLLPRRCLLCSRHGVAHNLCNACRTDLPWLDSTCRRCALPLLRDGGLCGHCLLNLPSFDGCRAAFLYASPVDRLIGQFKNQRRLSAGKLLTSLLLDALRLSPSVMPDLIAPVPLHWRRQLRRGFNQAAFIAEQLARQLDIPLASVAERRYATPKQQLLNRKQRLQNLHNTFVVNTALVADKHVVIVDDVVTTGATAEALSGQLKHAGARRVDVWALARTPAPLSHEEQARTGSASRSGPCASLSP
jgi:ComF family protein